MNKDNQSFIRAFIKFLKIKADSMPVYDGIELLGIDEDEPKNGFKIKFNDKVYLLRLYPSHYNNENASYINLRDVNRPKGKNSLIQYTIDNSNFIIDKNNFVLKQNKVITIGTKQEGLKQESEKVMLDLGFNENKIILQGEFSNPDFESITQDFFKWLRIRATTKLQLEEKYRAKDTEIEDVEKNDDENKITGMVWKLGCNWGSGKPSFYNFIKEEHIIIGVEDKKCTPGDLIVVTEGHQVNAIARIINIPEPVTSDNDLETSFEKFQIEYNNLVNFAHAEWYELDVDDKFYYQLQQGICKVQNSGHQTKGIRTME